MKSGLNEEPDEEPDDDGLVERFKKGDHEAFKKLYHRHVSDVYKWVLWKLKNPCAAKELTQDVFVEAWEIRERLRVASKFKSWLIGIANKKILAFERERANERQHFRPWPEAAERQFRSREKDPLRQLEDAETKESIEVAFNSLSEIEREVAHLRFLDGLYPREIVLNLKIRPKLVKSRLHDALKSLQAKLKRLLPSYSESHHPHL